MYSNGQRLTADDHFEDHIEHEVPIQVYLGKAHKDIGFIDAYNEHFILINNTYYSRAFYIFVSRPGY